MTRSTRQQSPSERIKPSRWTRGLTDFHLEPEAKGSDLKPGQSYRDLELGQ